MESFVSLLLSTLRVSTPLVFTSMGGLMSERAGVINIALEGLMLVGAFSGAAAASHFGSPWMGALFGALAGMVLSAIYGFFVIQMKSDQIVAGTAINLLAFGAIPLASKAIFESTGATPALPLESRFGGEPLFLALICVAGIHFWFRHSRLGLWIRFAGEHPEALSTAGIGVRGTRWTAVLLSGALAGLGGMTLSIFLSSSYSRGMTAGRGFMALAALIFGKWRPIPTAIACLFFGLTDALQIRLQGVAIFGSEPVPVQFIQILPYVVTVLVLAGFVGRSRAPSALGQPWAIFAALGLAASSAAGLSACTPRSVPETTVAPVDPQVMNAELMNEMIRVVFERELKDQKLFASYLNSLAQGGTFEGIYNGLSHSGIYRSLEEKSPPAPPALVAFVSREMADINGRLQEKFPPKESLGKPLPRPVFPTGESAGNSPSGERRVAKETSATAESAVFERIFARSSRYTLKRVLSDAAIRLIEQLSQGPNAAEEVAKWYGEFAARAAALHVDFGLAKRNAGDAAMHARWARDRFLAYGPARARDLVVWETLNRIHRIGNSLK